MTKHSINEQVQALNRQLDDVKAKATKLLEDVRGHATTLHNAMASCPPEEVDDAEYELVEYNYYLDELENTIKDFQSSIPFIEV